MQKVIYVRTKLFFFLNLADPPLLCASNVLPLRIELISNPKVKRTGYFSTRASALPNIPEFVSKDLKRKERMKNGNHKACTTAII